MVAVVMIEIERDREKCLNKETGETSFYRTRKRNMRILQ